MPEANLVVTALGELEIPLVDTLRSAVRLDRVREVELHPRGERGPAARGGAFADVLGHRLRLGVALRELDLSPRDAAELDELREPPGAVLRHAPRDEDLEGDAPLIERLRARAVFHEEERRGLDQSLERDRVRGDLGIREEHPFASGPVEREVPRGDFLRRDEEVFPARVAAGLPLQSDGADAVDLSRRARVGDHGHEGQELRREVGRNLGRPSALCRLRRLRLTERLGRLDPEGGTLHAAPNLSDLRAGAEAEHLVEERVEAAGRARAGLRTHRRDLPGRVLPGEGDQVLGEVGAEVDRVVALGDFLRRGALREALEGDIPEPERQPAVHASSVWAARWPNHPPASDSETRGGPSATA